MKQPSRWLVMRLSALGDVVLTTGVLDYLAKRYGWTFSVLTRKEWAGVFDGHPAVEKVIGLDSARFKLPAMLREFRRISKEHAGWGMIDLHGTIRSYLLSILWRGPVLRYPKMSAERRAFLSSGGRVGAEKLLRFNVPQRYALAVQDEAPERSDLLPIIYLTEAEKNAAKAMLDNARQSPLIILHPYSTHINKAWVDKNWYALAERLCAAGYQCAVVGAGKTFFADAACGVLDFTGKTSLRESCALLSLAAVVVTGDSGPMHLASAVGTPVVALFGPTHKAWGFYPEGKNDVVLEAELSCRPCSLHGSKKCPHDQACMTTISVDEVFDAVKGKVEGKKSVNA